MALATRELVEVPTEFGRIVLALEYDDALMRATGVICSNPSPNNVFIVVTRESDGRQISRTFGPGNTRLDIPTGQAARIDLTFNSRGGLDGYAFACTYPA